MKDFAGDMYGADRVTQVIALLAGATAESYGAVGLQMQQVVQLVPNDVLTPVVSELRLEVVPASSDLASPMVNKPMVEEIALPVPNPALFNSMTEEPTKSSDFPTAFPVQDTDLLSRFVDPELDFSVPSNTTAQIEGSINAGTESDTSSDAVLGQGGDSLFLSFLDQLIAQARTRREEFSHSFEGRGSDSAQEFFGSIVIEPIEVLSDLLGATSPPIGSSSSPAIGSLLFHSLEEPLSSFN